MSDELSPEAQRLVIERQILAWKERRFDVQIAHKVHTQLKSPAEALTRLVEELTMCEKALALLEQELKERA
jgi:hypothetical protein